jgi:ABC-type nitrate/sulfonate/bicarbonate transport system substrate-binding protein
MPASSLHGAILPLLLMPAGALIASCLGILARGSHGVTWFQACYVPYALIAPCFLAAIAGYYLVWKYVVEFLNRTLGIA